MRKRFTKIAAALAALAALALGRRALVRLPGQLRSGEARSGAEQEPSRPARQGRHRLDPEESGADTPPSG